MEENENLIESLLEKAADYGIASFELGKLKVVDKTSEIVSSLIPNSIVLVLAVLFTIFFNLGIAFWIGEILGKVYLGFAIVAAFYCFAVIIIHFFFHKSIKKHFRDNIIKQLLN
ncbi:MAG: hypothetical protein K9J13_14500 [Saprospiraceae bacterium]|nr:hypothetical protein [Saprospiraceae bacterium]